MNALEEAVAAQEMRVAARWRTANMRTAIGGMLPVVVVFVLVVAFSASTDAFLSFRNLTAVASQASILLLASTGATFVILMGSIDLSAGAIVLLVGAVAVTAINGLDLGLWATAVGVMLGTLLGLTNGVAFAMGMIPSFVVTLGSLSVFTGIALELLEGRALQYDSPAFDTLAIGQLVPHFPNVALIAVILWAVMVAVCFKTRFGRYMYVIGGGEAVARTSGVPVVRYKIYAFMLSGALAGIAGTLAVARVGAAGPTLGTDLLLNSLAAVVVGGTSLSGGVGGVHRTLLGVLIITILDDGLNLLGVNQYLQMVIKGAVVIAAVLVSQDRSRVIIVK
jgi:ribose/xylose/arabinose/galactoside ABC-type transport system permease subunit